jgi:RpiB/LacA/LacB family sugar-phosphate isomerase
MRTAIGSDHAGFEMKTMLARFLRELCQDVVDVGTHTRHPVDYPGFAEAVGKAALVGRAERGVLICGSGIGASVAAYLSAKFTNEERHLRRLNKVKALELRFGT